jgi:hypothetical protein
VAVASPSRVTCPAARSSSAILVTFAQKVQFGRLRAFQSDESFVSNT